jgi:DNA (cytosine-5)-methyltransferase 1
LKFIDLFSGIGGFRLALEKFNHKCVFSADFNKYACDTYEKNFNEYPLIDIQKYSEKKIPDHDILCAGFPCQPFSIAGKRKGFEDTRGTLFFDIARILKKKRPKIFILENVKGLVSHDKGNTFNTIINVLSSKVNGKKRKNNRKNLGYNVFWNILNSKDYNVPQNRERVFIIGFKDQNYNFNFPVKKRLKSKLSDIIKIKSDRIKKISDLSFNYVAKHLKTHKKFKSIKTLDYLIANEVRKSRCNFHYNNISPCLTTKMGTGGNNVPYLVNKKRFLSLEECLVLQGFPKNFKLTDNYTEALKQIGNSVTIPVIEEIIKNIVK